MKKYYTKPIIEAVVLHDEDILTASPVDDTVVDKFAPPSEA